MFIFTPFFHASSHTASKCVFIFNFIIFICPSVTHLQTLIYTSSSTNVYLVSLCVHNVCNAYINYHFTSLSCMCNVYCWTCVYNSVYYL